MSRKTARKRGPGAGLVAVAVIAAIAATGGSHGHAAPVAATSGNEQLANQMAASAGWDASEQQCLDELWTRESGFSADATNPSSGAYGIPQALPAGKMASAGPDWQTDPATQIRWGLAYLKERYGDPCNGWAHEEADSWY